MLFSMNDRSESNFGIWLWIFVSAIPIGLVLAVVGSMGSVFRLTSSAGRDLGPTGVVYFGIILSVVGILGSIGMLVGGIVKGQNEYKGTGDVRKVEGVKVLTKYVYNKRGEMVNEEYMWEDEDEHKFYVKLQMPDGALREFMTRKEVFDNCGEMMKGEAHIDGKWLGNFTPWIGRQDAV